eukprot:TCONS_00059972-protein
MVKVFVTFWLCLSINLITSEARRSAPVCAKSKDLLIVFNTNTNIGYYNPTWIVQQLEALVTSLLKDKCTEVWIYHNLRRQAIHINEENWRHFMYGSESDMLLGGLAAGESLMKIHSEWYNCCRKDKMTKADILYIYCSPKFLNMTVKDYKSDHFNLIFYCLCNPRNCFKAKSHLPRHHFVYNTDPYL